MKAVYKKDPIYKDGLVVRSGNRYWTAKNETDFINKVNDEMERLCKNGKVFTTFEGCVAWMRLDVINFNIYKFGEIDESELVCNDNLTHLGIAANNLGWIDLVKDEDDDDVNIEKLSAELELYKKFFNDCVSNLYERLPSATVHCEHDRNAILKAIAKGGIFVATDVIAKLTSTVKKLKE